MSTLMCLHFGCGATKLLKRYTAYHFSFMSCCLFGRFLVAPVADCWVLRWKRLGSCFVAATKISSSAQLPPNCAEAADGGRWG